MHKGVGGKPAAEHQDFSALLGQTAERGMRPHRCAVVLVSGEHFGGKPPDGTHRVGGVYAAPDARHGAERLGQFADAGGGIADRKNGVFPRDRRIGERRQQQGARVGQRLKKRLDHAAAAVLDRAERLHRAVDKKDIAGLHAKPAQPLAKLFFCRQWVDLLFNRKLVFYCGEGVHFPLWR